MTKINELSADAYQVPALKVSAEIKVKGSKFIASIFPAVSKKEAEEIYAEVKKKYYNATHNCLAYRIDDNIFRYSDDGEPSGTAGKPILQVLEGARLYQVLCVVTRYYGGTKLGTGGLIRAYSTSAAEALKALKIKTKIKTTFFNLEFKYEQENLVRKYLTMMEGAIIKSDYSGDVVFRVTVPQSKSSLFEAQLIEATHSSIQIKKN